MKAGRWVLIVCLGVSLAPGAAAQAAEGAAPILSLRQIEAEALKSNADVGLAAQRVSVAKSRVAGAGALDDPMFTYRDWGTPLERPWDLNQAQQMFMIERTLSLGGKRGLRTNLAQGEAAAEGFAARATEAEVLVRVRKAFFDYLRTADELRIHNDLRQLATQALETARIKYTVGQVPQQDVLKAQIVLTRLEEHLISVQQDADLARAALNTLMGRDPASPLQIEGSYSTSVAIPALAELQALAVLHRPELLQSTAETGTREQQVALARKGYIPDVTVGGGYMLNPPGSMARNNYMAEVSVSLPWLNRSKHDSEIAEAVAMRNAAKAEYQSRKNAVFLEIQEAAIRASSAQRTAELYRTSLMPQVRAGFDAASVAYQHDRTDFLNLIESQNMMLDVESAYYRSAAELNSRLAELERAIGTALPGRDGAGPTE